MAEFRVTTTRDGSRSFSEHDDRWSDGSSSGRSRGRGGGYRGNRRPYYSNKRGRGGSSYGRSGFSYPYRSRGRGGGSPSPRSRLDDEGDDLMGDSNSDPGSSSRYNPYGRPSKGGYRGGPNRRDNYNRNQSGDRLAPLQRMGLPVSNRESGEQEWFKVQIPWGKRTDKDFILKSINSHVDVPFVPTYYHYEDQTAVFYVSDRNAANSIRAVTKKVTLPTGYKMVILVKNSNPPNIPMGEEEIEKLKLCMSNRYDPATKALNLSSLHTDKDLSKESLYMTLSRAQVMSNVVKIIKENIPELQSLDMSENKMVFLDHLASLVPATSDLTVLNLSKNRINRLDEVRKLSSWKLSTLSLDGNPLCDRFSDQSTYISAVRKLFPKVLKLDGHDLPPPITFDIEARTDLPKSKENYFPSMDVQVPVVKFLKDYFNVYDSDNRSGLAGAYHDRAVFSLSVAYNGAVQYKQSSLGVYIDESRNLSKPNKDAGRKSKLLREGSQIISQLCLLPKTQHDPNSFLVDCGIVSPSMVSFTVQGIFKELDSKQDKPPIRAFSRTFVTVPGGASMLIVNDMLTITNASPDQVQSAFKNPAPTPSSSPVPESSPQNPFEGAALTDIQKQMIASFVTDSRMNSEWSLKCLMQNEWNYEKAGKVFMELQQQGKIPAEAFS